MVVNGDNQTILNEFQENGMIYSVPSFLVKLYQIVESERTDNVICWVEPDGDGFVIKESQQFCDQILPVYFKHNNFSSFIR